MTSKPKALQDIYTQNTGKRSTQIDHTWYFLEHGKMIDWSKRELSDVLKTDKTDYENKNKLENISFDIIETNKPYATDTQRYVLEHYLKRNWLNDSKINKFEKVWFKYFTKHFDIIQQELSDVWIILNKNQYKKIKWFIYKWDIDYTSWVRWCHYKSNIVLWNNPHEITIFHELAHYISNKWYKSKWDFLNECFTEIFAYRCCKKMKWKNEKLNWWHYWSINIISKMIELISIKISIKPEYILDYMIRWYFAKWNKWLNLFYKVFWKSFLKSLMLLWTEKKEDLENYKKMIINLSKWYREFWFNSNHEFLKYFDSSNKPSKEISDIIWIER